MVRSVELQPKTAILYVRMGPDVCIIYINTRVGPDGNNPTLMLSLRVVTEAVTTPPWEVKVDTDMKLRKTNLNHRSLHDTTEVMFMCTRSSEPDRIPGDAECWVTFRCSTLNLQYEISRATSLSPLVYL